MYKKLLFMVLFLLFSSCSSLLPRAGSNSTHAATATLTYSPPLAATFDDNWCKMTERFAINGILRVPSFARFSQWVKASSRYELLLFNPDGKQGGWLNVWIRNSSSAGPNEIGNLLEDSDVRADALIHTTDNVIIGDDTPVRLTLHSISSKVPANYYNYPCDFVVEEVQLP